MLRPWCVLLACCLTGCGVGAATCPPIKGLDALLRPGRVLLLGELHGTQESPAFALDVACHAAHAGVPIVIGLELDSGEQDRVEAYLRSKGTDEDRAALVATHTWSRTYQDGRNSEAMLGLIDGARRLREDGRDVRVVLFDSPGAGSAQARDRAMGANLATAAGSTTGGVLVALAGNLHTRVSRGRPRNPEFEPMGHVLAGKITAERIVALDVAHGNGTAWICAPECGVQRLGGHHGDSRWAIEIDDATRPAGHDGWYHVGAITASPPAGRPDLVRAAAAAAAEPPPAAEPPETTPAVQAQAEDDRPLSELESRVQGAWQAYDYNANSKLWKIDFDERSFHAHAGEDDWYKGRISFDADEDPAHINFAIEDCRCAYVGQTSQGIYYWEESALVVAAPTPGRTRPSGFDPRRGSMMRLRRRAQISAE